MVKKKDTRVSGVSSAEKAKSIEQTESVGGVDAVKPASGVGRVEKAGPVRRRGVTRVMSLAEREELFRIINEEADKLFADSEAGQDKKKTVASAVKMAIDLGMAGEDEQENRGQGKNGKHR